MSEETVKSHTKSIYRKLDVHSRTELMDVAEDRVRTAMAPTVADD
ncbi:MAG: LuxR C-terminal-related transcriptional regulator [Bifidobacteriaceae bacterium]|nr:LuxR C-terminal-related transcriptional regulator [Bifidobacteriaceae bacterium]